MKQTKSKKIISIVATLYKIIGTKKQLDKEEKSLKLQIKEFLDESNILEAGDLIVVRSIKQRSDIDKPKLKLILNEEELNSVTKVIEYETLTVKAA